MMMMTMRCKVQVLTIFEGMISHYIKISISFDVISHCT